MSAIERLPDNDQEEVFLLSISDDFSSSFLSDFSYLDSSSDSSDSEQTITGSEKKISFVLTKFIFYKQSFYSGTSKSGLIGFSLLCQ